MTEESSSKNQIIIKYCLPLTAVSFIIYLCGFFKAESAHIYLWSSAVFSILAIAIVYCYTVDKINQERNDEIRNIKTEAEKLSKLHYNLHLINPNKELKEQINENSSQSAGPLMRSTKKSALMGAVPRSQGMNLTGNDLVAYNFLKGEIEKVASGTTSSAVFVMPLSLMNDGVLSYKATELGYTNVSDAVATFQKKYIFDLNKVLNALLADCPYSLYWFDKACILQLPARDSVFPEMRRVFG